MAIFYINISRQVPVYYLNADFDYWNMLDWNRPDIDCLHTVNLPTKTRNADNDNDDFNTHNKTDAGGTSLAYARADDHLPLVVTDISGDFVIQIKRDNIKNYQNW